MTTTTKTKTTTEPVHTTHMGIDGKRGVKTPCGRNNIGFCLFFSYDAAEVTCKPCKRTNAFKLIEAQAGPTEEPEPTTTETTEHDTEVAPTLMGHMGAAHAETTIHLQDYTQLDGVGLCGESGRTMSHHEIKRGRISCGECLQRHSEPAAPVKVDETTETSEMTAETREMVREFVATARRMRRMGTAEIIEAVEAKTGLTIGGDHDKVVLALGYLSSDAMRQEVNGAVWANRKGAEIGS